MFTRAVGGNGLESLRFQAVFWRRDAPPYPRKGGEYAFQQIYKGSSPKVLGHLHFIGKSAASLSTIKHTSTAISLSYPHVLLEMSIIRDHPSCARRFERLPLTTDI